jgi:hypothetical protein
MTHYQNGGNFQFNGGRGFGYQAPQAPYGQAGGFESEQMRQLRLMRDRRAQRQQQPQQAPQQPQPQYQTPTYVQASVPRSHALRDGAVTYVAIRAAQEAASYVAYKNFVGADYASFAGFRIYEKQCRKLRSEQPRVHPRTGWVLVAVSVLLTLLAVPTHEGTILVPAIVSLLVGLFALRHRPIPATTRRELYDWHRAYGASRHN